MEIGPITITTEESGRLVLSGFTLGVLKQVGRINNVSTNPRSFADHIIAQLSTEPRLSVDQVAGWRERTVTNIVREWARHPLTLNIEIEAEDTLLAFRTALIAQEAKLTERWERATRSLKSSTAARAAEEAMRLQNQLRNLYGSSDLQRLIEQRRQLYAAIQPFPELTRLQLEAQRQAEAISAATRSVQDSFRNALAAFEEQRKYISNIFLSLPDPAELFERSRSAASGLAALEDSGYGFTAHLWDLPFLVELGQIQPGIRGAVATNQFAAFCRSDDFRGELQRDLKATPVLSRRWPVLQSVLEAHSRREYQLTVPALLAQLEGCITDMLILRGEAALYRGKLFARDSSGKVKKGRDGKRVRLTGLGAKLSHSRWKGDEVLESVSSIIVDRLIIERNAIMHGRRLSYPHAKLGTQCLLLIWVIAQEVRERIA